MAVKQLKVSLLKCKPHNFPLLFCSTHNYTNAVTQGTEMMRRAARTVERELERTAVQWGLESGCKGEFEKAAAKHSFSILRQASKGAKRAEAGGTAVQVAGIEVDLLGWASGGSISGGLRLRSLGGRAGRTRRTSNRKLLWVSRSEGCLPVVLPLQLQAVVYLQAKSAKRVPVQCAAAASLRSLDTLWAACVDGHTLITFEHHPCGSKGRGLPGLHTAYTTVVQLPEEF